MDVDFRSSRHAWVDEQRETPIELGWGWMFRGLAETDRKFIGRARIERELEERSSRWTTVGMEVDVHDYERVHDEAGILAPRHEVYGESTMSIYRRNDKEWDYAGYASSFLHSPLLRKPIAIAKLPLDPRTLRLPTIFLDQLQRNRVSWGLALIDEEFCGAIAVDGGVNARRVRSAPLLNY